ncbi:hypothetical protein R1flu_023755 [Riccia fluitans]|uniref:Uncharacterized protein n=1 Tax=Riccia fluitans TaxID=41844 RepID=A0ABD1XTS0_9MARC
MLPPSSFKKSSKHIPAERLHSTQRPSFFTETVIVPGAPNGPDDRPATDFSPVLCQLELDRKIFRQKAVWHARFLSSQHRKGMSEQVEAPCPKGWVSFLSGDDDTVSKVITDYHRVKCELLDLFTMSTRSM